MNNKASITDGLVLLIVLLVIGLGLIITIPVFKSVSTAINGSMGSEGQAALSQADYSLGSADTFFLILWFGLAMGALISAFFVRSHPVYLGFSILFFLPMLALGPIFTTIYDDVSNNSLLSTGVSTLPKTDALMNNLYIFNLVFGLLLLVVLYVSFRSGE